MRTAHESFYDWRVECVCAAGAAGRENMDSSLNWAHHNLNSPQEKNH